MALDEVSGQAWTRKHDDPAIPVVPGAPRTVYPRSLEELIQICATRSPLEKIHAAGSHWALSEAAISDAVFVETHDPNNNHPAMGRTLYEVVPNCLNGQFVDALARQVILPFDAFTVAENEGLYPIHVETGKRVYQLYAELDAGDNDPRSLAVLLNQTKNNPSYLGSWAFQTLGGAGGQTVFGALATGTHGGDFHMPPIADAVMALHLVADGGKHYWIEPESLHRMGARLTDDEPLRALYGQDRYGGPGNFEVIRDDNMFYSVLVCAGRFGIVYSIVIAAVRQYCLHQERRLTTWQEIRDQIRDPTSALYTQHDQPQPPPSPNKFLQIAVSVTPHDNFTRNLAGVTKRWNVPLAANPGTNEPAGRPERCGAISTAFDPAIQAPRFELAGNSRTYSPDRNSPGAEPSFLERACANANFTAGVIESVIAEVEDFVHSNGVVVGTAIAAITAAGGGAALLMLLAALLAILPILAALLALLRSQGKPLFGQSMNDIRNMLLSPPDPAQRAAGIFVWQLIAYKTFAGQQESADYEAISYAVMDGHDYFDRSCNINVDSIEVFFDATNPMLVPYVDELLAFEIGQEVNAGKAFVGYISLRFTGPTRARIGMQRFPLSCAIEVSGLRDATGVTELIDYATMLALDSNYQGILHWGQRNDSQRAHLEERFGDTLANPVGNLRTWRQALARITGNGRFDGFSNAFTRRTGLEIVAPVIGNLSAASPGQSEPITISWDCANNPPATEITLKVISPAGAEYLFSALPLVGSHQVGANDSGVYSVELAAAIDLAGERRETVQQAGVAIV
jgi:hypothetical protein